MYPSLFIVSSVLSLFCMRFCFRSNLILRMHLSTSLIVHILPFGNTVSPTLLRWSLSIHSCFLSFHASGISIKWPSHHGYALAVPVVMVSSSISSGFNFRSACSASLQNFGSFSFSCFKSSGVVRKMAPLPSALSLAIHWSKISFHSLFVASL